VRAKIAPTDTKADTTELSCMFVGLTFREFHQPFGKFVQYREFEPLHVTNLSCDGMRNNAVFD